MFWGLQLEANLRYSQQVPEGFRITKATLSTETPPAVAKSQDPASKLVQVFVDQDGSEYAVATLKHGEIYDSSMDLRFAEGEDICFYLKGDGVVFLSGHNLYPDDPNDEGFLPASALMGASSDEEDVSGDVDDDNDDTSADDGPQIEDITEASSTAKRPSKGSNGTVVVKKDSAAKALAMEEADDDDDDFDSEDEDDSADEDDSDDDEDEDDSDDDDSDDAEEPEKLAKGKIAPGLKRSDIAAHLKSKAPEPKKVKLRNGTPSQIGQITKRPNGVTSIMVPLKKEPESPPHASNESVKKLEIQDLKPGTGPVATKGKKVRVFYVGKLLNGKRFDQVVKGEPFEFKLGTKSVIEGWEKGVEGMRVGGKRRLLIPASMAYGKRRMGPIPPGSALQFEIELKAVV